MRFLYMVSGRLPQVAGSAIILAGLRSLSR